jgi:hypothetical protein
MIEDMTLTLEREGLDIRNVSCWNGRPSRRRGPPPLTYWEEYVATDEWYITKLTEDVPLDEMQAACVDEDFENDLGEEGDEEEEIDEEIVSDASGSYEPEDNSEASSVSEDDDDTSATGPIEEAEVFRTPER